MFIFQSEDLSGLNLAALEDLSALHIEALTRLCHAKVCHSYTIYIVVHDSCLSESPYGNTDKSQFHDLRL